ncbi:sulfite exporter TauE/SafE family protein [Conyzicola nivalis]|uniref:Probable membrane transporter protein n=1 Tax=Conyzicola nivalis TaxID=1477021 RepID=A0A916SML5_9MICO|nr:UPF0721 transmembrane protein [Conyzicola nivalis]
MLIGLVGGVLSGAFGIGGGIIMVPMLIAIAGLDQRAAAATSLVAIIPAALVGSIAYLANGEIDLAAAGLIAVGAVAGTLVGTRLLRRISLTWLRWLFIALIVAVAARMLLVAPERGESVELTVWVALGYIALGLVMGVASGLFGIGGGVIAVPALVAVFGASDLVAKGTSLLVMLPTAVVGTASNARARVVDVRAGLAVGIAATVGSVPGVALALVMPPRLSGILFAVLLLIAAVQLTVSALRSRGPAS